MKMSSKNVVYALFGIFAIFIIFYVATVLVPKTLVTFTKAAPSQIVSVKNSYVLGEKILAKADGVDKCLVNVFVLDATGKGIPGKAVMLTGADEIKPVKQSTTDNDGKVSFEITSKVEGQFPVTATVAGAPLPRELRVTFRN